MAAIGVYGFLVLVGFFFGIVTGYEKPRPAVAKKEKEPTPTRVVPEPKPTPKPTPNTNIQDTKKEEPKEEMKKEEPKTEETKTDPKPEPKTELDPKPEPKTDPKPEPKTDPKPEPKTEPKKEDPKEIVKAVAFKDVVPILRTHCANCHGAVGKAKADVDVTTYDKLMKSPSGIGKSIVAGNAEKSGLLASILNGEMPPEGKPKPTEKEIATLRNWILSGAKPRRRPVRRTKN